MIVLAAPIFADKGFCRGLTDAEKIAVVYDMYAEYKKSFPRVADISPEDAMKLQQSESAVFVDTRKPAEIAVSKIPGAITEEEFRKDPARHRGKTVIVYCTISYRSGMLAKNLAEKGIELTNLKGGILAWALEGGTVVDPQGNPVRKIHVYGKKWNYPPDGYQAVMFSLFER